MSIFLPSEVHFRSVLVQFRQKTLRNASVSHAKWPKNLTKRKRFACEMAKKPYEPQAFCLQNGQKTLRYASVSHAKWLKTLTKRERFACKMAQKHCETQAFCRQNCQKTLRNARVSHAKSPQQPLPWGSALAGWPAGMPRTEVGSSYFL